MLLYLSQVSRNDLIIDSNSFSFNSDCFFHSLAGTKISDDKVEELLEADDVQVFTQDVRAKFTPQSCLVILLSCFRY